MIRFLVHIGVCALLAGCAKQEEQAEGVAPSPSSNTPPAQEFTSQLNYDKHFRAPTNIPFHDEADRREYMSSYESGWRWVAEHSTPGRYTINPKTRTKGVPGAIHIDYVTRDAYSTPEAKGFQRGVLDAQDTFRKIDGEIRANWRKLAFPKDKE